MHLREREQTGLLLLVLLGLLEQVLQHLGVLEPVIELGVLLLVLGLRAQQRKRRFSVSQEGHRTKSLQRGHVHGVYYMN